MITEDVQPLSLVENGRFQNVIRLLDSRYLKHLLSRRTLTRSILPDLYSSTKNKFLDILYKSNYHSINSDIWTSLNTDSFMTFTVHRFNSDFVLKTFVLCTAKQENKHTGEYLCRTMKNTFNEWGIMHTIVAIVTDSEVNIKSAGNKLQIPHILYAAHTLKLIVTQASIFRGPSSENDGIELNKSQNLKDLLKKYRFIVTYLKKKRSCKSKISRQTIHS